MGITLRESQAISYGLRNAGMVTSAGINDIFDMLKAYPIRKVYRFNRENMDIVDDLLDKLRLPITTANRQAYIALLMINAAYSFEIINPLQVISKRQMKKILRE
jgi:hypothetical protein